MSEHQFSILMAVLVESVVDGQKHVHLPWLFLTICEEAELSRRSYCSRSIPIRVMSSMA